MRRASRRKPMDRIKTIAYYGGVALLWIIMAATTVHALHVTQPHGIAGK